MVICLNEGRREFASVCVCINLDSKLPERVLIEGLSGRFFQKIEYEKVFSFCFNCGKIILKIELCPDVQNEIQTSFGHNIIWDSDEAIPYKVTNHVVLNKMMNLSMVLRFM